MRNSSKALLGLLLQQEGVGTVSCSLLVGRDGAGGRRREGVGSKRVPYMA